ncbi:MULTISPECIES: bifunctional alpha,alpha-trehalose-phosphate synthase (UDP-forming)/trehalose-phosphatase [Olivibacter]|uniref:Bifunctional alpha,alpha-trehalose-phosphate synthase (UDP-forming)/trehalose-phosphatase n=1 Tax=Olivibacter oleidegradans TaxID=760123 RepID=A0ABV6HEZ2_9SPHI|nr:MULTISPECIES: bifunctional alpha,alpha-trehalose-phosphate synthase (UDP-forming)/trehalose-phosphatase [unclassified Olivibacter]MDM8177467.1 bifunctional alpha,alpha-trehalose-phosphate synthase (UDP-forming)/trehalose-phosphatase [Olivibacter sp. 47]QEK99917.1 bifunctional alpha,alpha-trehalose-phosphate synthase (UDP-forming)/trehalose-phosphatase [Olivibacter sp. LS-1]
MNKTIIVSNRLPVKIVEENNELSFIPSEGGLATGLGSIYKEGNNIWIGWPGVDVQGEREQREVTQRLKSLNLIPVFLNKEEIKRYYEGFSNEVLWPIFHYLSTYANYNYQNWLAYVQVNQKFADIILRELNPGDTVWVHDYQLLLVPGLIRLKQPEVSIAFFNHIPFPSQELFRLIPWRKELLRGMLGADLLGFHTFDDVRHFLSAATHLLPIHADANRLRVENRIVLAEPFPMGMDSEKFSRLGNDPEVLAHIQNFKQNFNGKKIILSIDRLDYSKGIIQRLNAFELLLSKNPEYIEQVTLYMIVVPSRDTVPQYKRLKDEIDRLVGHINARFRTFEWHPIAYFYHGYPIEIISALYNVADVCLVTPMRDGMNLVSKEYVASRNDNTGVLILSEMAGASKELNDALLVNPNNISEIRKALITALNMPKAEMEERMKAMRAVVFKFNIKHWVKIFMNRLQDVKQMQKNSMANLVKASIRLAIQERYKAARNRLLLFDYDGTLVGFKKEIDEASPDLALYNLLDAFVADKKNTLVIISGRKHTTLEQWFGAKNYTLIAEHGAWKKNSVGDWEQVPGLSTNWKSEVQKLMEDYTDKTPGSFIEEKSYSLAWHYRKVQKGLGSLRANELMDNLQYHLNAYGLKMLDGDKVVEVKNADVNKGRATLNLLHDTDYDFILAIGDDRTDEDTFKALPEKAISIKVGSNVSAAKYYLEDQEEVRDLLTFLVET